MSARTMSLFVPIIVATMVGVTLGQGVGGSSPTDTSHTLLPVASVPEDPISWATTIGTTAVPIGIQLDPAGSAWVKHLQTRNNAPITSNGGVVWIEENLTVSGSVPWTGWHSEIVTDGFVWYTGGWSATFAVKANGVPVAGNIQISGTNLDATFPALLPGTSVKLYQKFAWPHSASFSGSIELHQYPVPEPASLLFLAAGVALCPLRRR